MKNLGWWYLQQHRGRIQHHLNILSADLSHTLFIVHRRPSRETHEICTLPTCSTQLLDFSASCSFGNEKVWKNGSTEQIWHINRGQSHSDLGHIVFDCYKHACLQWCSLKNVHGYTLNQCKNNVGATPYLRGCVPRFSLRVHA